MTELIAKGYFGAIPVSQELLDDDIVWTKAMKKVETELGEALADQSRLGYTLHVQSMQKGGTIQTVAFRSEAEIHSWFDERTNQSLAKITDPSERTRQLRRWGKNRERVVQQFREGFDKGYQAYWNGREVGNPIPPHDHYQPANDDDPADADHILDEMGR